MEKNIACKMSDGVTLLSDVFRPMGSGKVPVILYRTPHDKENIGLAIGSQIHPVHTASRGYVAIVQDVRGRYA